MFHMASEKFRNGLWNFSDQREKEKLRISGNWAGTAPKAGNIQFFPGCSGNGRNPYHTARMPRPLRFLLVLLPFLLGSSAARRARPERRDR